MYYGRYSRESRRWHISWPLPSEILTHAKAKALQIVDDDVETTDDTEPIKSPAE